MFSQLLFHDCPSLCLCSGWRQPPGQAAGSVLSPVCFASSAHPAFADMRGTVGWEDFFLLCFCRKYSWLRAGHRAGLGLQAPVQRAWVGRGLTPTIRHSLHHLFSSDPGQAHLSPGRECPQPRGSPPTHTQHAGPGRPC